MLVSVHCRRIDGVVIPLRGKHMIVDRRRPCLQLSSRSRYRPSDIVLLTVIVLHRRRRRISVGILLIIFI